MTDRVSYLTVTLNRNLRTDDAKPLITAIKMLKGVVKVKINVADPDSFSAEARVKHELITKIYDILK